MKPRGHKKQLQGVVVSDRMDKSVMVRIERREMHPFYRKVVTRRKKFMAHNPDDRAKAGDRVLIEETRPLSHRKRWQVKKILRTATEALPLPAEAGEETEFGS